MRTKPIVITAFAISTAVAVIAVLNPAQKGDAALPPEQILASSQELTTGTLLRAQDITWQSIAVPDPDQVVRPHGAAEAGDETRASVYGAVLRHPLSAGVPIRRGDIVKPGDRD